MDEFSDLTTLSDPSLGDLSNEGTLGLDDTSNVQSDTSPDFSPLSSDGYAPIDNINGTSGAVIGNDPTNALNSTFNSPPLQILDALTGGALGLGQELAGDFPPAQANQPAASDYTPYVVAGVAVLALFFLVK